MATTNDLIQRALSLLGVVPAGQSPSAEDAGLVRDHIPRKLAELARRGVIYVENPDSFPTPDLHEIPPETVQWLAMLVAQDVAPDFGMTPDLGAVALAESRLKEMQFQVQTEEPIRALYF